MKKKMKVKWKNIFLLIILATGLVFFIVGNYKMITWAKENNETTKEIENLNNIIEIKDIEDNQTTQIIESSTEKPKKDNPYWSYIKMNLIDIDFADLKKINSDTAGWIQVKGTNINYPFVQTKDNTYYLDHSFDKSKNKAGWVFMDFRNSNKEFDQNTILYAHARKNQTMFGSLEKVLEDKWLSNTDNHIIKTSTEYENSLWQVFSVYKIPTTSDYLQVQFTNDEEFLNFGEMLMKRSIHDFKTTIAENDKIITLSTCYKKDQRIVIHAKLIKTSKK